MKLNAKKMKIAFWINCPMTDFSFYSMIIGKGDDRKGNRGRAWEDIWIKRD